MLRRSTQREVCVKAPLPGYDGNAFEAAGRAMLATVQPMSGDLSQRMYGLMPAQMRRMLCAPGAPIAEGDGVCVDVPPAADPDYRVVCVARWTRVTDAHLRYIPEAERGVDT